MKEQKIKKFKVGEKVFWMWLGRPIYGQIVSIHEAPIVIEIKGKNIKRNGSPENPAYHVQSDAGNFALKLGTELQPHSSAAKKKKMPTIFGDD